MTNRPSHGGAAAQPAKARESRATEQPPQPAGVKEGTSETANERAATSASDVVLLKVGGRLFETNRATLCVQPDTLLAAMFSGRWEGSMRRDEATGAVCLDLNPDMFATLLDFLRALLQSKTSGAPALPCASVSAEKWEEWEATLSYLAFSDTPFLSRFSSELSHTDFALLAHSAAVARRSEVLWAFAVLAGSVGRGVESTWRLRMGAKNCVAVGFCSEAVAQRMREETDIKSAHFAGVYSNGDFKAANGNTWDTSCRFSVQGPISQGHVFELHINTQVVSHSDARCVLPREWERYRLVVVGGSTASGVEILSVE